MKYEAQERDWVARLLARLSPDQRRRYEVEMAQATGDPRNGKKYDRQKAECAERIMYDDALKVGR